MTRCVVVTGPESSGKTTLAVALASHFGAPLIPEAARDLALQAAADRRTLTREDVEPIARRTIAAYDAALALRPEILVLDTDLVSTVVYARSYYGSCAPWIEAAARERRADLYLLCDVDVPWTADGVRDRPLSREEMLETFARTLEEFDCTVARLHGLGHARKDSALRLLAARGLMPARLRQTDG